MIATPGRLIDHLHNAPVFHINDIEILILDEADRYVLGGVEKEFGKLFT